MHICIYVCIYVYIWVSEGKLARAGIAAAPGIGQGIGDLQSVAN